MDKNIQDIAQINEMVEREILMQRLDKSKKVVKNSRRFVEVTDYQIWLIREAMNKNGYSVRFFAEQILAIDKVSLSRKLTKARRFRYYELKLIEEALKITILEENN
jgi:hypothetical protein